MKTLSLLEWAHQLPKRLSDQRAYDLANAGRIKGAKRNENGYWSVPANSPDPRKPVGNKK